MDYTHQMEHFSEVFIKAFAAPLGFNHSKNEYDNDSVDLKLIGKDYTGKYRSPEIHIQLKSTADPFNKDGTIHFQMKKKNYEDLRGENIAYPRYLFLYSFPKSCSNWLIERPTNIELFNNGYWYSLRLAPSIGKGQSKVVRVPKTNLISKAVLLKMMDLASNGESL
jgi:hypothetical protein